MIIIIIIIVDMLMNHSALVTVLPLKIAAQRKYRQMKQ
jgi:hypothetical protein